MEFFADTASLEELNELISLGVVDGCTTNPKIVSTEGADFEQRMKDILSLVKGPVSIEVTTNDTEEMLSQARKFRAWGENVVVKIPMSQNGMKAVAVLASEGIKTNVTACMSTKQAVFAAKAGATYVSLFWARIEDMGHSASDVVENTANIFAKHRIPAKIIIGSFRQISHINAALKTGAHVLTVTPNLLYQMIDHPRTTSTIDEFLQSWAAFEKK